jgi:hypothetical protein
VLIISLEGIFISMINRVNAIANTPSQKASKRELVLDSAIITSLFDLPNYAVPLLKRAVIVVKLQLRTDPAYHPGKQNMLC